MTLTFRNDARPAQIVQYDLYLSDVANAFGKWSKAGTATSTSTDFIQLGFNGTLVDVSVPTGLTDTTKLITWINDAVVPGTQINYAQVVNTLPSRSFPPLKIAANAKLQFVQLA